MRYDYARLLLAFTEEFGVGLGVGEVAEIEEAELRVYGLASVLRSDSYIVMSNLPVEDKPLPWEPDVLGPVAHELLSAFIGPGGGRADDE